MGLSPNGQMVANRMAEIQEVIDAAQAPAFETTQNHYGYYANVIGQLGQAVKPDDQKAGHYLAAEALKIAGANKAGVDSAMHAMFGYEEYSPMHAMFG